MQSDSSISRLVGSSVTPGLNNVAVTAEGSVTVSAQLNTDSCQPSTSNAIEGSEAVHNICPTSSQLKLPLMSTAAGRDSMSVEGNH